MIGGPLDTDVIVMNSKAHFVDVNIKTTESGNT